MPFEGLCTLSHSSIVDTLFRTSGFAPSNIDFHPHPHIREYAHNAIEPHIPASAWPSLITSYFQGAPTFSTCSDFFPSLPKSQSFLSWGSRSLDDLTVCLKDAHLNVSASKFVLVTHFSFITGFFSARKQQILRE